MDDEPNIRRGRETWVTMLLVLFAGGVFTFFLNLISLGVFAYVLLAAGAFTIIGFLHYVLWGYAMSQETAAEREQYLAREEKERPQPPDAITDLSRRRRF